MRYRWLLLPVLAVLLAITAISAGGPPDGAPGLDRAIAAQEAHTDRLLANAGVVGTSVGLGGGGQAVVQIYTKSAKVGGLPSKLNGVPIVVQVTGEISAQEAPPRPSPIGVSSGPERLTVAKPESTEGHRWTA